MPPAVDTVDARKRKRETETMQENNRGVPSRSSILAAPSSTRLYLCNCPRLRSNRWNQLFRGPSRNFCHSRDRTFATDATPVGKIPAREFSDFPVPRSAGGILFQFSSIENYRSSVSPKGIKKTGREGGTRKWERREGTSYL